ncbi:EcsC family protein [Komagataeibacter sp. AV436]|uniref:EcsC family protein n=1 Tax=Komagataeibacter melomenusus TaxID=2766578 RepID=A0ABX2AHY3_9PROT|nr:EcsC family protein [Komagataeibacter melomenusus]MBV1832152.1 EcsC family protein [Komagataeibacter melomenusus]NPC67921.1 EcsC family protein [Komagataeibacter melomenusus]
MSSDKEINIIGKALEWSYGKAVTGFGTLGTAQEFGDEYLRSNKNNRIDAANSLIRWQNTKAATNGFITNMGGLVTLPVAIPANMASTLYIQLRMIAGIAHIGGHDILDDRIKTLCYVCLTGNSATEIIKATGIEIGKKLTASTIQKYITGEMIKTINKTVGFRLATKAGSTGLINVTKMVPLIGGVLGGTVDAVMTNIVGNTARNAFIHE